MGTPEATAVESPDSEHVDSNAVDSNSVDAEDFDTEALAVAIVEAAWERKARNVRVLDVRGVVSYTDFIIVCHGTSEVRPLGIEGADLGEWILVDFGDAVLHVFDERVRGDYAIESIYSDVPRLALSDVPEDLEDPEAEVR